MQTICIATRGPINDPFSSQQGGVDYGATVAEWSASGYAGAEQHRATTTSSGRQSVLGSVRGGSRQ